MSWLACIEVEAETAFANGVADSYAWHQRLWDCFPRQPDRKRDFLTRIDSLDSGLRLWMLSPTRPSRPNWCPPERFAVKEVAVSFLSHRHYAFSLRANPVKCLVQRNEQGERRRHGKRVALTKPDELREWLERKAVQGGFRIVDDRELEIGPMAKSHFRKRDHVAFHGGVEFRGVLEVVDSAKFRETYYTGVGSAKGFGFGMLLLAPVEL
ncbi:MAG: type I-E CRISPR-associated protein Cas6/Cse3/CasE [Pirellulales bacterium]